MYYDQQGVMKAAGAEAEGAAINDLAEDEGWLRAELCVRLFKYTLFTLQNAEFASVGSSFASVQRR